MARTALLVFALLLLGSAVFAQVCKEPAGVPDASGMCNCNSGYASTTIEGTDCNIHPRCAGLTSDVADAGGNSPLRPITSFTSDHLTIVQRVPIVSNRKGSHIQFQKPLLRGVSGYTPGTPGAETCFYPGALWTKTVDALDCVDVFTASIPWTQSDLCGFVKDTNITTTQKSFYKSTLVHSFSEIRMVNGKTLSRTYKTSYLLSVSFLTQKTFSLNDKLSVSIVDPTVAGFVKVAVTGNSMYDASTGITEVEFTTTSAWPYMLKPSAAQFKDTTLPVPGLASATIAASADISLCPTTTGSECTQKWTVSITTDNDEVCDIAGQYNFEDDLVCRDINNAVADCVGAALPKAGFSINMKTTDLCAAEEVDTSAGNTYTLTPYFSSDADTPTFTYQTGDEIYWVVEIVDPLVSIDSVKFNEIEISTSADSEVLLLGGEVQSKGLLVNLNHTNSMVTVSPGSPAILKFSFKLDRSALANTVASLGSVSTVQLTTTIVADIVYHGNQRTRDVEDVEESLSARSSTFTQSRTIQVKLSEAAEAAEEAKEASMIGSIFDNSASSLHSVFGLFVALFVAVALKF